MTSFKVTPEFIIENCKLKPGQYPCAKQSVYCCIRFATNSKVEDDRFFFGTNWGMNCIVECPRAEGEGYEKCKALCWQAGHAEIDAIRNAGDTDLKGAIAYLTGHTRICDNCFNALKKAGISKAYLLDNNKEYTFGGIGKENKNARK
jgi:deoxycytidylate deaminase